MTNPTHEPMPMEVIEGVLDQCEVSGGLVRSGITAQKILQETGINLTMTIEYMVDLQARYDRLVEAGERLVTTLDRSAISYACGCGDCPPADECDFCDMRRAQAAVKALLPELQDE